MVKENFHILNISKISKNVMYIIKHLYHYLILIVHMQMRIFMVSTLHYHRSYEICGEAKTFTFNHNSYKIFNDSQYTVLIEK